MKTFEEVYPTIPGNGWLTEGEARLLWDSALVTEGYILEVGCHNGRSTCLLAALGRPVICVDPWAGVLGDEGDEAAYLSFRQNLTERGHLTSVFINRCRVEDWAKNKPPKVGFAYLDGDHTYDGTVAQVEKAIACRADAITLHDCNDTGGGAEVKRAALELLGPWQHRVERLAVWTRNNT